MKNEVPAYSMTPNMEGMRPRYRALSPSSLRTYTMQRGVLMNIKNRYINSYVFVPPPPQKGNLRGKEKRLIRGGGLKYIPGLSWLSFILHIWW